MFVFPSTSRIVCILCVDCGCMCGFSVRLQHVVRQSLAKLIHVCFRLVADCIFDVCSRFLDAKFSIVCSLKFLCFCFLFKNQSLIVDCLSSSCLCLTPRRRTMYVPTKRNKDFFISHKPKDHLVPSIWKSILFFRIILYLPLRLASLLVLFSFSFSLSLALNSCALKI